MQDALHTAVITLYSIGEGEAPANLLPTFIAPPRPQCPSTLTDNLIENSLIDVNIFCASAVYLEVYKK